MNPELLHPLMFIKPLDAVPKGQRRRRGHERRRGANRKRTNYIVPKRDAPKLVATRRSVRLQQKEGSLQNHASYDDLLADLNLSESDSDDADVPRRRSNSISYCKANIDEGIRNSLQTIELGAISPEGINSINGQLLDDLRLSSESLSSTSSSSSSTSSQMTAPSDSDRSITDEESSNTQGLAGSLKGDNYFWIRDNPNLLVDDFKKLTLDENVNEVLEKFQFYCREYSAEKASIILIEKLVALSHKKCANFLNASNLLFRRHFFGSKIDSIQLFGRIVVTIVVYWYRQKMPEMASKFVTFLSKTCRVDPLNCLPFELPRQNCTLDTHLSGRVQVGVVCCQTSLNNEDYIGSINYLIRALRPVVENNDAGDLDHLKASIKLVFETLIFKIKMRPLCVLFLNILDMQEGLDCPVDLTLFYDCILCHLVASSETTHQKLALNLFQKVNYWQYFEASGVACRGLLIVAALLNRPRSRLNRIFSMCLNKGVYPQFNLDKWVIDLYTSMSKIEMQIYLEYCVRAYIEEIWSGRLNDCRKTFLTFRIIVVSSASVRDYVLPVHRKIKDVDHTFAAALFRLKMVIHHYSKTNVDRILHEFDEGNLIMFGGDVERLFKKVLRVDSLDRSSFSETGSCVLCE